MITKLFEVRDVATFIPVMAVKMKANPDTFHTECSEEYLLRRAGFWGETGSNLIGLAMLSGEDSHMNFVPHLWNGRTMTTAHKYISEHFDVLNSGSVIDVEFILGESASKKLSERLA